MESIHKRRTGIKVVTFTKSFLCLFMFASALVWTGCGNETSPEEGPPGDEESPKTEILEGGSATLQTNAPLDPMDVYLAGFHPMKENPSLQVEAHHFCRQVNEDFAQCVLFDGNTEEANLTGIEFIISESLFETLPDDEKQYWHPHNYEILSGQLVAPGLPEVAEMELMETKINSYGKTWHVWNTGTGDSDGDQFPTGEAMLAWSFNRDGEIRPEMIERRDSMMDMNMQEKRLQRQELVQLAHPQSGVDVLLDSFPRPTEYIPGVEDEDSAQN